MNILVINAGSSSLKFALFDFDRLEPIVRGLLDWADRADRATVTLNPPEGEPIRQKLNAPDCRRGVVEALALLRQSGLPGTADGIRAIGHRLIHGGEEIRRPVRIDEPLKRTIAQYAHLAPLHIPAGLDAIRATEEALPGVPQFGLFDTAYFGQIPPAAYLYPLPYEWYERWGIRRFGYHGTSHQYCAGRAAELLARHPRELRLVVCHLGQGSSATAVDRGTAVMNTMGFTPLEGVPMGTRCGTLDPGILLHVQRRHGLRLDELEEILHKKSGLLGLSGVSSDFRRVEAAARDGHPRARLALDVYAYRVRALLGALAVSIGGLDALVFTGGIGENSAGLRSEVCRNLECLGLDLDAQRNEACRPDCDIATEASRGRILVIHTREDLMIAREARRLLLEELGEEA